MCQCAHTHKNSQSINESCVRYCVLAQVMQAHGVQKLIFSSSATVYGEPQYQPLDERHPVGACTNPYGRTKYFIEEILRDVVKASPVSGRSLLLPRFA